MRTLTLKRCPDSLGAPRDIKILSDEYDVGLMKADENTKVVPISKGGHSLQCEITDDEGNCFRSAVIFVAGGDNVTLSVLESGSRIILKQVK